MSSSISKALLKSGYLTINTHRDVCIVSTKIIQCYVDWICIYKFIPSLMLIKHNSVNVYCIDLSQASQLHAAHFNYTKSSKLN